MTQSQTQRLKAVPAIAWLLLLTGACLLPFLGKAFHIDDTLFIRVAQHIQKHPANFLGFEMNWFGQTMPMVQNFENPPLACYYLAVVASLVGWREWALHLAFLLPALAAAWAIYSLASFHCKRPLLASVISVLTPAFMISATNLMCDVLLLAFWIWALVLFEQGLEKRSLLKFLLSGLLVGLGFLTKYSALALIPLLLAYGFCKERRLGPWVLAVLVPLPFVIAYEWLSFHLYGRGLLMGALGYASSFSAGRNSNFWDKQIIGLGFLGGCCLPLLFYAPFQAPRRFALHSAVLAVPCALLPLLAPSYRSAILDEPGCFQPLIYLQCVLFLFAGSFLLLMVFADLLNHRDSSALVLLLWTGGMFVFATSVNWTINGRTLLPAVPAIGILVARYLEKQESENPRHSFAVTALPMVSAASLSLLLTWVDFSYADFSRDTARALCQRYFEPGRTLWFVDHWGFQYYAEEQGAKALESSLAHITQGDTLVMAAENKSSFDLPLDMVQLIQAVQAPSGIRLSVMSQFAKAGFYAAACGSFPFSIGPTRPARWYVFKVIKTPEVRKERNFEPGIGTWFELADTVRTYPKNINAHLKLGYMLASWSKNELAEKEFENVLCQQPRNGMAHLGMGIVQNQQRNWTNAVSHYQSALRTIPDSVRVLCDLAWIQATAPKAEVRNGRDAVQLAERAADLTGHGSPEVMTILSAAYAENGMFDRAVATAQATIELARKRGQQQIVTNNEELLSYYRSQRPYRNED